MGFIEWLRIFSCLLLGDLKIIKFRLSSNFLSFRVWYKSFLCRKIYKERSILYILISLPSRSYSNFRHRQKARSMGISSLELYKQQTEKLMTETAQIKSQIQIKRVESMQKLADLVPGATIHDYNELKNGPLLLSVRFIISGLRNKFK